MAEPSTSLRAASFLPADPNRAKFSPERAKANYLSGQLRLRLQYAKLKVEHGWQRQTLNEVENLYFRHTQMHRPLPAVGHRNIRALWENVASASSSPSPFDEHTQPSAIPPDDRAQKKETSSPQGAPAPPSSSAEPPSSARPRLTTNPREAPSTSSPFADRDAPMPDAHPSAPRPARGTRRKRPSSSRPSDFASAHGSLPAHPVAPPPPLYPAPPAAPDAGLTYDSFWSSHASASHAFRAPARASAPAGPADDGAALARPR